MHTGQAMHDGWQAGDPSGSAGGIRWVVKPVARLLVTGTVRGKA